MDSIPTDFLAKLENAWSRAYLNLKQQQIGSHWVGQLSTSALSTATAISALTLCKQHGVVPAEQASEVDKAVQVGCDWLSSHQNSDGGFGDTDRSYSNIATTFLVRAAWQLAGFANSSQTQAAQKYIDQVGSWDALRKRYGKDKTFVVPIMTNCALAGLAKWSDIPSLPFEAAWLPQSWYRLASMPVVSYAIPALVAMGQAKFHFHPPLNPLTRALRRQAIQPTLKVLTKMQPLSGGYLEAVPLTSFVLMSLAAVGRGHLPVAQQCLKFILDSRLADGSWPIDTNLATWVTSLAINSMGRRCWPPLKVQVASSAESNLPTDDALCSSTIRWLLSCQHRTRHPFTGADPGGWGWTDLSGAVPDADDTPAALLALAKLDLTSEEVVRLHTHVQVAVVDGLRWLVNLQNRNGGWPTFCRGWGKLPFDRSGTDLTAHAIRAIEAWLDRLSTLERIGGKNLPSESRLRKAVSAGWRFLSQTQRSDGSWLPLWFGNQDQTDDENPVYGTAKVLLAYAACGIVENVAAQRGIGYLLATQNSDGGWGGGPAVHYGNADNSRDLNSLSNRTSTLEETALALEALLECGGGNHYQASIMRGLKWLAERIDENALAVSQPIGFYFAKLWYYEKLYPTLFSLAALGSALRLWGSTDTKAVKLG